MTTYTETIRHRTTAGTDIIDISQDVHAAVEASGIACGLCTIAIPGSTASITTIEYESGVVEDLKRTIDEVVPRDRSYAHDARWGDGNGYSHIRAALFKPSLTVPVIDGGAAVGTWQQIVLLDFDNKPRSRSIHVCIVGT